MKFPVCCLFLLLAFGTISQNPIPLQVSLPVYFDDVTNPYVQSKDKTPLASLTGIVLLYLDTSKVQEEVIITGLNDPIIWFDQVGISTKVRFIVSDSANITSLDLLYANNACTINILKNEQAIANGSITKDFGVYSMRLVGNERSTKDIFKLFEKLNDHLLRLHTKDQKKIPISPFYDSESLNIIFGVDKSFDTNYNLQRFDETLRNRIKNIAIKSYLAIDRDELHAPIKETMETNARVEHLAEKIPEKANMIKGKISTVFKMQGEKNYLFLKSKQEYLIEISYKYEKWKTSSGRLMIEKISVRNLENDDFVTMDVFDFTWNGLPILYVDLIKGVVMEDKGAWKADQVVSAVQDIFRLVKFPNES